MQFLLLLFSHQVMPNSSQPHGLQYARLPYPSPSPGVCPSSWPNLIKLVLHFSLFIFPSLFFLTGFLTSGLRLLIESINVFPEDLYNWNYLTNKQLIPALEFRSESMCKFLYIWKNPCLLFTISSINRSSEEISIPIRQTHYNTSSQAESTFQGQRSKTREEKVKNNKRNLCNFRRAGNE